MRGAFFAVGVFSLLPSERKRIYFSDFPDIKTPVNTYFTKWIDKEKKYDIITLQAMFEWGAKICVQAHSFASIIEFYRDVRVARKLKNF